jgi:hypothetical protein
MRQEEPPHPEEEREEEQLAEEEAEAAAAEAGEIGGSAPEDTHDPAERPLVEGGEGEAEGFELAEERLEDIASHGDQHRFPGRDASAPEEPSEAAYGEPDQPIPDDE